MESIEKTAKTTEAAIQEALGALGLTRDEVNITIIDEGHKGGLFGFGSRPARVRAEKKRDPKDIVRDYLREITVSMGLSVQMNMNERESHLYVDFTGENLGILVGKRGQTLDALQHIVNLAVGKHGALGKSIVLDTANYRKRRRETLESLAKTLARKVQQTQQNLQLEPMTRFERHVIHAVLQSDKNVHTYSDGTEPFRHVVIVPK